MRCQECGYEGVENVAGRQCVKCGSLLQNISFPNAHYDCESKPNSSNSDLKQTVIQGHTSSMESYNLHPLESNLKSTVIQSFSDFQSEEIKQTVIQGYSPDIQTNNTDEKKCTSNKHLTPILLDGKLECPKCHYPLSSDNLDSCPNCMADFTGLEGEDEEDSIETTEFAKDDIQPEHTIDDVNSDKIDNEYQCANCKKIISPYFNYCPYCSSKVVQKTIVSRKKSKRHTKDKEPSESASEKKSLKAIVHCCLSLIPDDDENIDAIKNVYEGENIILNRTNTEPNNPTITSKEQAALIHEDGNWFVENRSQLGTTYFAVNRRVQLMPGDIIMLGDRRFFFGVNEAE